MPNERAKVRKAPGSRPLAAQRRASVGAALASLFIAGYLGLHAREQGRVRSANELGVERRYADALAEARRVDRSPAKSRALVAEGQAAQALGRHREAVRALRAAAERDPRSWFIRRDLAISLSALGRRREAREQILRAAALNPRLVPPPGL